MVRHLWSGVSWLWKGLGQGRDALSRPVGVAAAVLFRHLGRSLAFAGPAISTLFIYLGRGAAWVIRHLWSGVSRFWIALRKGWAAASMPIWGTSTIFFQNQGRGLRDSRRYLSEAVSTMSGDLQAALALVGRSSRLTLTNGFRYARTGLTFGVLTLAVAAGVLVFSPLIPLRLVVDRTFRQETAARFRGLWTLFKARPAVGLLCLGAVVVLGLGLFWLWRPDPTVEVLIWTSGEKQDVMLPALNRLKCRQSHPNGRWTPLPGASALGYGGFRGNACPSSGQAHSGNRFSGSDRWRPHGGQPFHLRLAGPG